MGNSAKRNSQSTHTKEELRLRRAIKYAAWKLGEIGNSQALSDLKVYLEIVLKDKMMCEIRWCKSNKPGKLKVNENIGDESYAAYICVDCANTLSMKENDDLPEPHIVQQMLKK